MLQKTLLAHNLHVARQPSCMMGVTWLGQRLLQLVSLSTVQNSAKGLARGLAPRNVAIQVAGNTTQRLKKFILMFRESLRKVERILLCARIKIKIIYFASGTQGVVAQSPDPGAHDTSV